MHSVEVTQSLEERAEGETGRRKPCLCESYARVTESAALAAARWLGSGDQASAEGEAVAAMRAALDDMPIRGRVVIGASNDTEQLPVDQELGRGGDAFDLAVHPLEGRGVVARGGNGAMSMIAVGEPESLTTLPQMYMRRMAVGPVARGRIDLLRPVGDNIRAIAEAFGRRTNDITTIVLDRPRHHDLIEDIRAAGARIKLIQDGDVTASISAAIRGTNDHLAVGIGGTRQAVASAALVGLDSLGDHERRRHRSAAAGRGSRARDGHRGARARLRRRGVRTAREGAVQPHLDGLPGGPADRAGHR